MYAKYRLFLRLPYSKAKINFYQNSKAKLGMGERGREGGGWGTVRDKAH